MTFPLEHFVVQKGGKYPGLTALAASDLVHSYDYIWFPDDDLLIDGRDINRAFALARACNLLLAQPALEPGCFVNHRITASCRSSSR